MLNTALDGCNSLYAAAKSKILNPKSTIKIWPRSTMDSIRASEAPDPGSIPGEATIKMSNPLLPGVLCFKKYRFLITHCKKNSSRLNLPRSCFNPLGVAVKSKAYNANFNQQPATIYLQTSHGRHRWIRTFGP